jgi:aminoglycoside/choline kinase family phosphotransferase
VLLEYILGNSPAEGVHFRELVKESFFVHASYVEQAGRGSQAKEVHYVAQVRFFIKISPVAESVGVRERLVPQPLRVAVATLLEVEKDATPSGVLWRHKERRHRRVESYAVLFKHMLGKVISAKNVSEEGSYWFVPYSNLSGK